MAEVRVNLKVVDSFSNTLKSYQREMDRAAAATTKTANAAGSTAKEMSVLDRTIKSALAGITIGAAVRLGKEMYNLGLETRVATVSLEKLSATAGGYEAVMDAARRATGGVVDDLTLMHGANRFLTMGIAQTSEEVAKLTQAALVLGRVMGYSGQEAIESFSLLLSNESVLRLDNFGLSAARVRQRIAELREENEGWTRSDAFRQAVLDEITEKFGLLGDAADAAYTPVKRLETILTNLQQDASTVGSTILDSAVQTIFTITDGLATIHEFNVANAQSAELEQAANNATATAMLSAFSNVSMIPRNATTGEMLPDYARSALPPSSAQQLMESLAGAIRNGLDTSDWDAVMAAFEYAITHDVDWDWRQLEAKFGEVVIAERNIFGQPTRINQDVMRQAGWTYWQEGLEYIRDLQTAQTTARQQQRVDAANAPDADADRYWRIRREGPMQEAQRRAAELMYYPAWDQREYSLDSQQSRGLAAMQSYMGIESQGSYKGNTLLSPVAIANMQAYVDEAERLALLASSMQDRGLISEDAEARIVNYSNVMKQIRDNAVSTREEFDNLSLGQLMGQTSGGRAAEMDAMLVAAYGEGGATADQVDAFSRALGLDSGSLTLMSEQWKDVGIPMILDITEDLGIEAGVAARAGLLAGIERYGQMGYTGALPYDLIMQDMGYNLTSGSIDYGGTDTYDVKAGDTLYDIAHARGMTVDQVRTAAGLRPGEWLQAGSQINFGGSGGQWAWQGAGAANAGAVDAATAAAEGEMTSRAAAGAEVWRVNMSNALSDAVDTFSAAISAVEIDPVKVPFELVFQMGGNTSPLMQIIANVINGNGGTAPGSGNNTGRSNTTRFDNGRTAPWVG